MTLEVVFSFAVFFSLLLLLFFHNLGLLFLQEEGQITFKKV